MSTVYVNTKPSGSLVVAIMAAEPGDKIVYHVGEMCGGAHRQDARLMFERNLAILVSRRVKGKEGIFEYLAIRASEGAKL